MCFFLVRYGVSYKCRQFLRTVVDFLFELVTRNIYNCFKMFFFLLVIDLSFLTAPQNFKCQNAIKFSWWTLNQIAPLYWFDEFGIDQYKGKVTISTLFHKANVRVIVGSYCLRLARVGRGDKKDKVFWGSERLRLQNLPINRCFLQKNIQTYAVWYTLGISF